MYDIQWIYYLYNIIYGGYIIFTTNILVVQYTVDVSFLQLYISCKIYSWYIICTTNKRSSGHITYYVVKYTVDILFVQLTYYVVQYTVNILFVQLTS